MSDTGCAILLDAYRERDPWLRSLLVRDAKKYLAWVFDMQSLSQYQPQVVNSDLRRV